MSYDSWYDALPGEEIEAAPAPESLAEIREKRLSETIHLNRWLVDQARQMQQMMLEAPDLGALLEVLLVSMPRHFGFRIAELWLDDPENVLAGLMTSGHRYGQYLQLHHDVFEMQELYDMEPQVMLLDATDSRMFDVLKTDQGIQHALLVPLLDSGRLLGSYHCGLVEQPAETSPADLEVVTHLASIGSLSFKNAVSRQQISRLTMLDPLTQISNLRGFEKDIAREIARARRGNEALSVLMLEVDEFEELYQHYGEITGRFVLKKVSERVSSGLRATDYLARLSESRLAILLPATCEAPAIDVAERLRKDVENLLIDDGRGAVLQVTLSLGLVTWEPERYPAVDMAQLARHIQSACSKAVQSAVAGNGNKLKLGRLSALMI
jgi:diguanylate cyclase (GGDEF)-like protein